MTDSKLTALVALCDLSDDQPASPRSERFDVSEAAQLANGDIVVLRYLGWTSGYVGGYWRPDLDDVLSSVENVVLPDEDDPPSCEPHPWEWLATLAAKRGISVTAEQLKEVPYRIYLSDRAIKHCT